LTRPHASIRNGQDRSLRVVQVRVAVYASPPTGCSASNQAPRFFAYGSE